MHLKHARLPIPPRPRDRQTIGNQLTPYFLAGAGGVPGWAGPLVGTAGAGAGEAGAGAAGFGGAVFAGAVFAGARFVVRSSNTDVPRPAFRVAMIESVNDVTIKATAEIVVAFDSSVAEPRGPKAVWEPMPPNAPAKSAAFPLCNKTTMIRKMQTIT